MEIQTVYRVQDQDGRGPWKPGFSHRWAEERADWDNLLPWYVEFGRVDRCGIFGMHMGSACVTLDQLRRWFTASEYATLCRLGYQAVRIEGCTVLAESSVQCFIQRTKPFCEDFEPVDLYPA